jgi:hypothetical protein
MSCCDGNRHPQWCACSASDTPVALQGMLKDAGVTEEQRRSLKEALKKQHDDMEAIAGQLEVEAQEREALAAKIKAMESKVGRGRPSAWCFARCRWLLRPCTHAATQQCSYYSKRTGASLNVKGRRIAGCVAWRIALPV